MKAVNLPRTVYDEKTKRFTIISEEDDNEIEALCNNNCHEFPAGSFECSCGKYDNIHVLKASRGV
jgi:hypothetical protein